MRKGSVSLNKHFYQSTSLPHCSICANAVWVQASFQSTYLCACVSLFVLFNINSQLTHKIQTRDGERDVSRLRSAWPHSRRQLDRQKYHKHGKISRKYNQSLGSLQTLLVHLLSQLWNNRRAGLCYHCCRSCKTLVTKQNKNARLAFAMGSFGSARNVLPSILMMRLFYIAKQRILFGASITIFWLATPAVS